MMKNTVWQTFSVFISSTFADMQAERDYLKNVVFPRLEEELNKHQIRLDIVDLRWGVEISSIEKEEEREINVLKVCLEEIKRCRPFFIGLLGDRYGWVPTEERIKQVVANEPSIQQTSKKSVTALEIEFGVLANQDQLVRSSFYFREPLPYDLMPTERAAKYNDNYNSSLSQSEKEERSAALERLKTEINHYFAVQNLPQKVKTYVAEWDAQKQQVTSLDKWGETVYDDLLDECQNHAREIWDAVPHNPIEEDLALLDSFVEQYTHVSHVKTENGIKSISAFCGRQELVMELTEWCLNPESPNSGLVLTGESGSGKSAVFSALYRKLQQEDNCFILAHSAGISPRSARVFNVLERWIDQLSKEAGIEYAFQPEYDFLSKEIDGITNSQKRKDSPIEEMQKRFVELLRMVSEKKRVIIMIDALDRFESTPRAQYMSWLPSEMPVNVRLLVTAIGGTESKALEYHKSLQVKSLDLFSQQEAEVLLEIHTLLRHKALSREVKKILLEKKREDGNLAVSSPLWLSLALNILMAIDQDDFEKIARLNTRADLQIETYLVQMAKEFSPVPEHLFLSLLQKAGVVFGKEFTSKVFNYIGLSRNGLREKDLEALLQQEWSNLRFANLRRWFRSLLILQGEEQQWELAHSILRNAIKESLTETNKTELHQQIADHLLTLEATDSLHCTETLHHLTQNKDWERTANYLGANLNQEEISGSITFLCNALILGNLDVEQVAEIPQYVSGKQNEFSNVFNRFLFNLNEELEIEGQLQRRKIILKKLYDIVSKDNLSSIIGGINLGSLYGNIGEIHQSIGDIDEAMRYFNMYCQLMEDLYKCYPNSQAIKNSLAITYSKLGSINQLMGHIDDAKKYLEANNQLLRELNENDPCSESLNNLSLSFSKLGDVYQSIGNLEQAKKYMDFAVVVFKTLMKSNPICESKKRGLVTLYLNLGDCHRLLGDINSAQNCFKECLNICQELYKSHPNSISYKSGLALSYERMGVIHQITGHLDDSLKCFEKDFELQKELFESNKNNESFEVGLAISYSHLGDVHQSLGHYTDALCYYKCESDIRKRLNNYNTQDETVKEGLAITYFKLGKIYNLLGQQNKALQLFEKFNQLSNELNNNNKHSESLKENLAISFGMIGEIYRSMGKMEVAIENFKETNMLLVELVKVNAVSENLRRHLATSYSDLGDTYYSMGNIEKALFFFKKDFDIIYGLSNINPSNESLKYDLAVSYHNLGKSHFASGNFEEAMKNIQYDLEIKSDLLEANNVDVDIKDGLASSYSILGDIYDSMGLLEYALECYVNCNKLMNELYEISPISESFRSGLANSFGRLGKTYLNRGNLKDALIAFESSLKINKELFAHNPNSEHTKECLAYCYLSLGDIYKSIGNLKIALKYFQDFNNLLSEQNEEEIENESVKRGLATSYSRLGDIYQSMGNMTEALKYYEKDLKYSKDLSDKNIISETLKNSYAISNLKVGEVYQRMGNLEDALKYFKEYLRIERSIFEANPLNESNKEGFACSYEKIGEIYESMGRLEDALVYFDNFNRLIRDILDNNPNSESHLRNLALSYSRLGHINILLKKFDIALVELNKCNKIYKELFDKNSENEVIRRGYSISYEKLGNLHREMGQLDQALLCFEECYILSKKLLESNKLNEELKSGFAVSVLNLGLINHESGHLSQALDYYIELNNYSLTRYDLHADREDILNDISISYEKLGNIYIDLGYSNKSIYYYKKNVEILLEINNLKITNIKYYKRLGFSYYNIATLIKLNNPKESGQYLLKTIRIFNDCLRMTKSIEYKDRIDICISKLDDIINNYIVSYDKSIEKSLYDNAYSILMEVEPLSNELIDISFNVNSVWTNSKIKDNLSLFSESNSEKIKYLENALKNRILLLETVNNVNYINVILQNYEHLSWYYICEKEYMLSELNIRNAIELANNNGLIISWIYKNLAHALIFLNKFDEAKKIYIEWKDIIYPNDSYNTFKYYFLQDFDELEKAGITHPDIARIRELLK